MSYGIRISDEINRVISVSIMDILSKIDNGNKFYRSILFLDGTSDVGEGNSFPAKSLPEFENTISESKEGFFVSWENLNILAEKFFQIKDITLLG